MNPIGTRDIYTKRLHLRKILIDDAEKSFVNWASDKRMTQYLRWEPHINPNMTRSLFESWQKDYGNPFHFDWMIVLDGEPIGRIGAHSLSQKDARCEISYCIGSRFWGRGYTTEALEAVMDCLFSLAGLNKLEGKYDERNAASGRVMEKAGMTKEGLLRSHTLRKDGSFANVIAMGITKEEWKNKGGRA